MATKVDIRKLRKDRKMTLQELATKAGIGIATLWRAERNRRWPEHRTVREALQKALA